MKVKAYAGDKIEMHRIAGTEKIWNYIFRYIIWYIFRRTKYKNSKSIKKYIYNKFRRG